MGHSPLWASVSWPVHRDASAVRVWSAQRVLGLLWRPQSSPSLLRNCFSGRRKQTANASAKAVNLVAASVSECLLYCEKDRACKRVPMPEK